jgi:hypothetical protein
MCLIEYYTYDDYKNWEGEIDFNTIFKKLRSKK